MRLFKSCLAMGLMAWSVNCLSAAEENCQQFQVNNGRISIPVTIAGTESRAVINSGILAMGVSSSLVEQLGLDVIEPEPVSRRGGGSLPQLSIVENVPVRVFNQDIEMEQLYVFDLDAPLVNLSVMMFRDLVVQMDYPQSRICFLNPATINLEAAENINMRFRFRILGIETEYLESQPSRLSSVGHFASLSDRCKRLPNGSTLASRPSCC